MPKLLIRIAALLLIPCLIAEQSSAALIYEHPGIAVFRVLGPTRYSLIHEQAITPPAIAFAKPFAVAATVSVIVGIVFVARSHPNALPFVFSSLAISIALIGKIFMKRISPKKVAMMMPFFGAGSIFLLGLAGITAVASMPILFPISIGLASIGLQSVAFWGIRLHIYRNLSSFSQKIFIQVFSLWRYANIGIFVFILGFSVLHAPHISRGILNDASAIFSAYFWAAGIFLLTTEAIGHEIYVLGNKAAIGRSNTKRGGFIGREIKRLKSRLERENVQLLPSIPENVVHTPSAEEPDVQLLVESLKNVPAVTLEILGLPASLEDDRFQHIADYIRTYDWRTREEDNRITSCSSLAAAIRRELRLPADAQNEIYSFLRETKVDESQELAKNLVEKYHLVIAPYYDGEAKLAGAVLYTDSAKNPLRVGMVGTHKLSLMGIHEPIVVDIQKTSQPWEQEKSAAPSNFMDSHGMHASGTDLGIYFGKNIANDAEMIAAHLANPNLISPLYTRVDRVVIQARLGESHMRALETIASKLLFKAFPTDKSVAFITGQMIAVTSVHELAHILNHLIAGSYHSTNREEMAARLQEAIWGGNPYLALYMVLNAGSLAPKEYAIDSLKMLDSMYELAVGQSILARQSTHQVHDIYDDLDARIRELVIRIEALSNLEPGVFANLAKEAFVKEFGYEPEKIDLSTFIAAPALPHRSPSTNRFIAAELRAS